MLLDEPTASVDASSREQIFDLLAKLTREITIILVTHDLLRGIITGKKPRLLKRGLVYHGEPEINENVVNSLYGCPVDLIAHGVPHRVLKEHGRGLKVIESLFEYQFMRNALVAGLLASVVCAG